MDDREWISPGALEMLDSCACASVCKSGRKWERPLLSDRAKAVKEAVETRMARCSGCPAQKPCHSGHDGTNTQIEIIEACSHVTMDDIRRAYLSGPTIPAPVEPKCETCGGTGRVKCPKYHIWDGIMCGGCPDANPRRTGHCDGTIPCPDCKEEGR